jgi:aryl-alcohol dehydrogenase-like predicted oxidoreductase
MNLSPKIEKIGTPKLVLGTANFGMQYGIVKEKVSPEDISSLLSTAHANKIEFIDTASGYGSAEENMGRFVPKNSNFKIITKLSINEDDNVSNVLSKFTNSLEKLNLEKTWAVLIHNFGVLLKENNKIVIQSLLKIRELKLAEHIGISIYTLDEVIQAKELFPELKVFQVPGSICDRRMSDSNILNEMSNSGNFFFVRSIFHQGLLIMNPDELPIKLAIAKPLLKDFGRLCEINDMTPVEMCIAYGKSLSWAHGLVIGANNRIQLMQIIEAYEKSTNVSFEKFPQFDEFLIDPRLWTN